MPVGSQLLKAHEQDGQIMLWALVPLGQTKLVDFEYQIVATGQKVDAETYVSMAYFDTVFVGSYVWHIFIKIGSPDPGINLPPNVADGGSPG